MKTIENHIFEFAYGAGLHDATMQQAYSCSKGEKKKLSENKDAIKIVKAYIDNVIKGNPYDFYKTADKLVACFNEFEENNMIPKRFAFGNAQKLINITTKFMYIATYACSGLKENFKNCHCPLDRIIGKFVKNKVKRMEKGDFPDEIVEIIKDGSWKKWDGTWSSIEVNNYKKFQIMVKYLSSQEGLIPVEYDYFHW